MELKVGDIVLTKVRTYPILSGVIGKITGIDPCGERFNIDRFVCGFYADELVKLTKAQIYLYQDAE